ncbi:TIM barrel protein [Rudanella paleaurantiibacter]|uniref:TIM barrel protein n=1 Tax=Rudanella paleaurantiibacter TaxID=2614655 RepID=A0A7J5TWK8_9BACT|nr:sugar phosphate isomerase/epimerase family protein [Rudanella paleaurantiibacter]KAB7729018.1 TIM barrel protein [Rudanella paleaurantiibacter]
MNRRTFLQQAMTVTGASVVSPILAESISTNKLQRKQNFLIGACDWSIGGQASLKAFDTARQIGLDGIQVSLNSTKDEVHLRDPAMQGQYREAARQTGVQIGGLALGILNEVPYKSEARTEVWVQDSVDVAKALGIKTILLAFFGKNDLKNDAKCTQAVIDRLKAVAPKAEKAGVVLGIESWLSAPEHLAIIEAVGSPAVKVYYDVCNSTVMGYDIFREMRDLGTKYICEVHIKENDYLIGQGVIDMKRVRATLDAIGYRGWLQLEGAVPKGKPMLESYLENNRAARQLFG